MRYLIGLVFLLIVVAVAATALGYDHGTVTFYLNGLKTDFSLNLFAVMALLSHFLFLLVFLAIRGLLRLPQRWGQNRRLNKERQAIASVHAALADHWADRDALAQKSLQKAIDLSSKKAGNIPLENDTSAFAYLIEASIAHQLQHKSQRDVALAQTLSLSETKGSAHVWSEAAKLRQAQWALEDGDAVRCLELLQGLPPAVLRRPAYARVHTEALLASGQYSQAMQTTAQLQRKPSLLGRSSKSNEPQAHALAQDTLHRALHEIQDFAALDQIWLEASKTTRKDPHWVAVAVQKAADLGQAEQALPWFEPVWDKIHQLQDVTVRDEVARAAIALSAHASKNWLKAADKLYALHQPSAPLSSYCLAACGLLYARQNLWGRAISPLQEASKRLDLDAATRRLLLHWLAHNAQNEDRPEQAEIFWRQARGLESQQIQSLLPSSTATDQTKGGV